MTPAELLAKAEARGVMIATAESCTGGLLAADLTHVPGASKVVERGFVTYTDAAKAEMLGVSERSLADHGAVSEPVAGEMAAGALARSGAHLAVSITGIAGPGRSDHKPEGRVCFGIAFGGTVETRTVEFGAMGRGAVRAASVAEALRLMGDALDRMG